MVPRSPARRSVAPQIWRRCVEGWKPRQPSGRPHNRRRLADNPRVTGTLFHRDGDLSVSQISTITKILRCVRSASRLGFPGVLQLRQILTCKASSSWTPNSRSLQGIPSLEATQHSSPRQDLSTLTADSTVDSCSDGRSL